MRVDHRTLKIRSRKIIMEQVVYTLFANKRPVYHGVNREDVKEVLLCRTLAGEKAQLDTIRRKVGEERT